MTNSIFTNKNLSTLNFEHEHTLCVGLDNRNREVVHLKKISYVNAFLSFISFGFLNNDDKTSFFDLIKYILKIDTFSFGRINKAMLSELNSLEKTGFVNRNVQYINKNFFKDRAQYIPYLPGRKPEAVAPQNNLNPSIELNSSFDNKLLQGSIQKYEGIMLNPGELAIYPQLGKEGIGSSDVLYLGLNPEASQYYDAAMGRQGGNQGSPSCTLFAMQFINDILFSDEKNAEDAFNKWVDDFSQKSPEISKQQENIISSVRKGLRVELLKKKLDDATEKVKYQVMFKAFLEANTTSLRKFRKDFISNRYFDLMDPKIWNQLQKKDQEHFLNIKRINENKIKEKFPNVHPDELQALGLLNRELTEDEVSQIVELLKRPLNLDQILTEIDQGVRGFLTKIWKDEIPGGEIQKALHEALKPACKIPSISEKILNDNIKPVITMSYIDQRFSVGDLQHEAYEEVVPEWVKDLSVPRVIKHTEAALSEVVKKLTSSKKSFPYAVVTTPNNKTYSIIYSSKRDLAIVFDSHRSCAHLVKGEEGLFSLLKNIHTEQNVDSGKIFQDGQKPPFFDEAQEVQLDPTAPDYEEQLQMLAFGGGHEAPDSIVSMYA